MRGLFLVLCVVALVAVVVHPCSAGTCAGGACGSGICKIEVAPFVMPTVTHERVTINEKTTVRCTERCRRGVVVRLSATVHQRKHRPVERVLSAFKR